MENVGFVYELYIFNAYYYFQNTDFCFGMGY